MGWAGHEDPALEAYVAERQERALLTYENDPDLHERHMRQEGGGHRVGGPARIVGRIDRVVA